MRLRTGLDQFFLVKNSDLIKNLLDQKAGNRPSRMKISYKKLNEVLYVYFGVG